MWSAATSIQLVLPVGLGALGPLVWELDSGARVSCVAVEKPPKTQST